MSMCVYAVGERGVVNERRNEAKHTDHTFHMPHHRVRTRVVVAVVLLCVLLVIDSADGARRSKKKKAKKGEYIDAKPLAVVLYLFWLWSM